MNLVNLADVPKYYTREEHQVNAVTFLGEVLLDTPAKERLHLKTATDWIKLSSSDLDWLHKQISIETLTTFTRIWRHLTAVEAEEDKETQAGLVEYYESQLDSPINKHVVCNSVSHWMMYCSIKDVNKPVDEYVRRVMRGEFGRGSAKNPSIYWDVHTKGLRAYDLQTRINSSGNFSKAIAQSEKGILTPTNICHRGHINNQRGGHVVCLAGMDGDKIKIFDPYGELNYITGVSDLSKKGIYSVSKGNFLKRWQGVFCESRPN